MQFSESNKLQYLEVNFQGIYPYSINYTINNEFIGSFQIDFGSSIIQASLLVEDSQLLNSFVQFQNCVVSFYYADLLGNATDLRFRVLNVNHVEFNNKQKQFEILLQDEVSYLLKNSYLGKSYKDQNLVSIMNEFVNECQKRANDGNTLILNKYFEEPFKSTSELQNFETFVVPKHINNLRFFEEEALRQGLSISSTRTGFVINSQEDLEFQKLPRDIPFVENEGNQHYKNLIHQVRIKELIRDTNYPNFSTYEFNYSTEEFLINENNESRNFITDTNMNQTNVIQTIGTKPVFERISQHPERNRREKLNAYGLEIVVSGYCDREVNTIQEVSLKGNKHLPETRIDGDTVNSGEYIIQAIQDRYVNGHLIQRLFLKRQNSGLVQDSKMLKG